MKARNDRIAQFSRYHWVGAAFQAATEAERCNHRRYEPKVADLHKTAATDEPAARSRIVPTIRDRVAGFVSILLAAQRARRAATDRS